jgi:P4 family phage/plasmid primase-like protien
MNITSSQYQDLNEFLAKHSAKNEKREGSTLSLTHTRIPDKSLNVYGGSYIIPKEELQVFHSLYYESVFVKKKLEYLTEVQIQEGSANGPILIDFDFRYSYDVDTRQHTKEHITDILNLGYLEILKEFFIFQENKPFPIYVMQKPNVNRLSDGSLTKDGIHIIIGIQMDHIMQVMMREKILEIIGDMWGDLPLINAWDAVLDQGISKGKTNWQMFGSRKPGNMAYELSYYFKIDYDKTDGEFMMQERKVDEIDLSKDLFKLSAQYDEHPKFELNPKILDEYNKRLSGEKKAKITKSSSKTKIRLLQVDNDDADDSMSIEDITNQELLKKAMDNIIKSLKTSEYEIKELHDYTQTLPEMFYEPGSHDRNTQVAFALKNTDERLFLSWVMLRSKASDFDYASIPELYLRWKKFPKDKQDGVTKRSILYWSKQYAYDNYIKVKKNTIYHFIEESLTAPTEWNFAIVLHHMFKDKYICSSLVNRTWYVFRNHRWERDLGESLRMCISIDMFNIYQEKINMELAEMQHYDANDDRYEALKKKTKYTSELALKFKKTSEKNNIMKEALEIFYDENFVKNMDTNNYLICFSNGVVDIKNKLFRDGYPQDYITKSTCIPYYEFDKIKNSEFIEQVLTFMEQLFPKKELNRYMWDHLASCLIGECVNQTFNIYLGCGSNGKSILADLMTKTLGDYKAVLPITLITSQRNGIGGTSSEVMQLKGVRYAVMQEPSKDARINEGVMKEITGGDPIQARALYCESETFNSQAKLVVCTNTLFEIGSNDDGTWRRIRICDFESKFVDPDTPPSPDTPYQFPKDKYLKEKLPNWAPIFASMLVKRAFETQGYVEDCDIVMSASNKYRQGQDHISAFISEMVGKKDGKKISKRELCEQFKLWYQDQQGSRKAPKGVELCEYMDKKFGKCKKDGWHNVEILYPDQVDEIDAMD